MKLTNQIVIEKAKELGFDLVGFTPAQTLTKESEHLKEWLDKGYHATMDYMARNFEKRLDVKNILLKARSVISLAMNYNTNHHHSIKSKLSNRSGKVSRYAWGKDYHIIIWEKLELFKKELRKIDPDFDCLTYVDTGPVMDKVWAERAGIGWLGKHTNIITREMGSWVFLSTVITNYEFDYNKPVADFCGSCTACIDACPTKAIANEYVVDANKCISFLTIENKGEIPNTFKDQFDDWIFGCDICQDVCPWNNKFSVLTNQKEFEPAGNKEIPFDKIEEMTPESFKKRFETSPIKRAKLSGLKRNAAFLKSLS
ncbi:MAG: tRNA epoxyqueuosine(34) reductase QueG [Ignavibacteriales bacterium]|nr:tRNA epoxyqueuosine(34) reductase QueG [Ignavibacteriales bacterium]